MENASPQNLPDLFFIDRNIFRQNELTAIELAVLLYIYSDSPFSFVNPRCPTTTEIVSRFSQDKPVDLLLAIKGLVKKGYLEDVPSLEEELLSLLHKKHGTVIQ